ncbi:xylulokinase [Fretibacter rubidus]|uniref:xylulokinase n=1 Tax=Fretibacter rubidus TaxID=570162 RepID=UPI003529FC47
MYLGIDIGTSGVKAVLVDDAQNIVDQASAPLSVQRPQPLWSEQDPADWWAATCKAVTALDPHKRSGVKAIGLSGQMHGATCLDDADNVLRRAILWNDGRSAVECSAMMGALPSLTSITGNLAMPGFTAPKLVWMQRHEPETFKKTAKVLLPKDYVRLLMSGDYASDMSDSAGTLWMDVAARDWSDDVLSLTGLHRKHMPDLFEGSSATGKLSKSVANDWGMDCVPIAGGGGDNAAGAVGSGTISSGDGFISLGTSGVVFLADGQYRPNPESAVHTFCHALPALWHQMSVMLSAASAVDFVAKITGFKTPADLYATAEHANEPGRGAMFLPYLSGERTPHNNPNAKGAFFGLTHEDNSATLAQAALEGVAFALADGIDALRDTGASIETLSVIGGGARSLYWGKILASAFDVTLHYRGGADVGPAFGAARLARLCVSSESAEDICTPPPIEATIEPDNSLRDLYSQRRVSFQKLYQNTKDLTA